MDTHPAAESHSSSFSSKIKSLDFYRKLPQDISEKSSSGGFGNSFPFLLENFFLLSHPNISVPALRNSHCSIICE